MFKLLFILAAAFALAAAAHSAPLEFQHLEEPDADLLFSDVADDLDMNDDLEEPSEDSETETDDELIADGELDESDVLDIKNGTDVTDDVTDVANCPLGTRLQAGDCVSCPGITPATPYTVDGNTGVCSPCDPQTSFIQKDKMCLTSCQQNQIVAQENFVKQNFEKQLQPSSVAVDFPDNYGTVCMIGGNSENGNSGNKGNGNFGNKGIDKFGDKGKGKFSNKINGKFGNKRNGKFGNKKSKLQMDLQTKSCPPGQSCCLQGWYGEYPNCVQCPESTPSSPRTASGGPDSNCNCPNAAASSCFACTNVCRPFNAATGICTPICSACKVRTINGVKTPTNCN